MPIPRWREHFRKKTWSHLDFDRVCPEPQQHPASPGLPRSAASLQLHESTEAFIVNEDLGATSEQVINITKSTRSPVILVQHAVILVQHAVIFGRARRNLGTALHSRQFSWNFYSPRTILLLHGTNTSFKCEVHVGIGYVICITLSTKNQDPHWMNHL